jgi:uncharacterized protein YdeI (YjbR/CyaY-like superfamily)
MARQGIHKELVVHTFRDQKAWMAWLQKNFAQDKSIWIKLAKKGSGLKSITYEQGREGAIIYGWIDGLINGFDENWYLIKFSPRRPKSNWSKINRGIAEQLIKSNRMKPSGLQQVESAKADGRWDRAYDGPSSIKVPPELQKLLDTHKTAKKNFDELHSLNRYAFLYRIQTAKREATGHKHILKAFEMLKKGEVYHPDTVRKKASSKKAARKKK